MRINIEREALDLSLIDLSQAFGMKLPVARETITAGGIRKRSNDEEFREDMYTRAGAMYWTNGDQPDKCGSDEAFREDMYVRGGTMYGWKRVPSKRSNEEEFREDMYTRGGSMYWTNSNQPEKRSNEEEFREDMYTRGGSMYWTNEDRPIAKRSNDEEFREDMYTRGGSMYWTNSNQAEKRGDEEEFREDMYVRAGTMFWVNNNDQPDKRSVDLYTSLANRDNLALGAIERVNIANRILGKPEITMDKAKQMLSKGDDFVTEYWRSSMKHGGFWTGDQVTGKPNFIEGGQVNGFGFTQSTFHKLHCLANLRMMLAWHINGNGTKMTRDMNVHAMHCLEYIRGRELKNPDLNEEPIDTVDYKGMGIH